MYLSSDAGWAPVSTHVPLLRHGRAAHVVASTTHPHTPLGLVLVVVRIIVVIVVVVIIA